MCVYVRRCVCVKQLFLKQYITLSSMVTFMTRSGDDGHKTIDPIPAIAHVISPAVREHL